MRFNKYKLYEESVQSPEVHIEWFANMYERIRGKKASHLREDFCGTFRLSCEWIRKNPDHTALCLDLDSEPLQYGLKNHWAKLSSDQKSRLHILKANVLDPTSPRRDLIIGCNFSFFIFKERKQLLKYFQSCHKSLNAQGVVILEMAGGPGMITQTTEQKTVVLKNRSGKTEDLKFKYYWDQKSFDPISRNGLYAIHFKLPDGKNLKNAFTYDWRLWTLPEIKDILEEAGFKKTDVFWETAHKGKGTGEYLPAEKGDNAFAWVAYLVSSR